VDLAAPSEFPAVRSNEKMNERGTLAVMVQTTFPAKTIGR
jgi:hypothetical protein